MTKESEELIKILEEESEAQTRTSDFLKNLKREGYKNVIILPSGSVLIDGSKATGRIYKLIPGNYDLNKL